MVESPSLINPNINIPLGNLSESRIAWLNKITRKELSRVKESLGGIMDKNLKFHFTTIGFDFKPANDEERDKFLLNSERSGWTLQPLANGTMHVTTGYERSIRENGLKKRTCVAALPDEMNQDIATQHPRLYLESLRKIIKYYGKHAVPYKHRAFMSASGTISNLEAGLVIADSVVPTIPKGQSPRSTVSTNNFLKPGTHYTTDVVNSDNILTLITFSLPADIVFEHGKWRYAGEKFIDYDIQKSILGSLPNHIGRIIRRSGGVKDEARTLKIVNHLAGKAKEKRS